MSFLSNEIINRFLRNGSAGNHGTEKYKSSSSSQENIGSVYSDVIKNLKCPLIDTI